MTEFGPKGMPAPPPDEQPQSNALDSNIPIANLEHAGFSESVVSNLISLKENIHQGVVSEITLEYKKFSFIQYLREIGRIES